MNFRIGDTGIYSVTSPSGHQYIGSTVSFRRRWALHLRQLRAGNHHNVPLQNAYNKYGGHALVFEKMVLCAQDKLIASEQAAIDMFGPAYNTCQIAGSTAGVKLGPMREDHKRKIGNGNRGLIRTEEQRAYLSTRLRGRKMPAEHIAWLSEKQIGAGNHFFGKSHSPETIANLSGRNHHSSRAVVCIETGQIFGSIREASSWLRANGFPKASPSPICACCKQEAKYVKPYGFTWRYEEVVWSGGRL